MQNILDLITSETGLEFKKKAGTKGGEYKGPCPFCGGKDRFCIWPEKGRYDCPRHCEKEGDAIQFVRDYKGLSFKEAKRYLGMDQPKVSPGKIVKKKVAEYLYTDLAGVVRFKTIKKLHFNADGSPVINGDGKQGKSFVQCQPDGRGGWIWNLKGVEIIPYNLPAITNASTVFLSEGEQCVELLKEWGVPASCNPMGAGKWQNSLTPFFKGKQVVILPDNDEQGKKHAQLVASKIHKIAKAVKIVNLSDLPLKGDIVDWAEAGHTKDELFKIVAQNRKWKKGNQNDWAEPISLETQETPKIPLSLFSPDIQRFVSTVAGFTQTPPELAIGISQACISAACRGRFQVEVKPGYIEPLNEYFTVALDPGERKTPVFMKCLHPIVEWEREQAERLEPEIRAAKARAKAYHKRLEHLQTLASKATGEDFQTFLDEISLTEQERPDVPELPRIYVDDITSEAFVDEVDRQCGALALFSDEGGIFETMAGRYNGGTPNFDIFLKGHSGSPYRNDRKGKQAVIINSPRITMGLAVQPDVIRELGGKPGFRGRGLLARFKYFLPESLLGRRNSEPEPLNEDAVDAYNCMISVILNTDGIYTLHLSEPAYRAWIAASNSVESELAPGGKYELMKDWAGKMPGTIIRMAGLLHIANGEWEEPIDQPTMQNAIEIVTLLADHAAIALGLSTEGEEIAKAKNILAWIIDQGKPEIKGRDIQQKFKGKYRTVAEIQPGLDVLMEREYIRDLTPDKIRGKIFAVNPFVLSKKR